MNSYFALVADDPSVQIVNAAQSWYVRAPRPDRAGSRRRADPVASAPFKCGGRGGPDYYTDVPAGPIAIKHVADLYVYPNGLRVVRVTGAILREWLERSASLYRRIDPNSRERQPLVDGAFASYNFDVVDGVTYAIDVTQAARYDDDGKIVAADLHRIVELSFEGRPVDPAAEFLIATNSYRAGGGGRFPGCDGASIIFEAPDSNRDVLVRYIHETGHLDPRSDDNWRFAPWPDTAVVTFVTSPAAANVPPPSRLAVTLMARRREASSNTGSRRRAEAQGSSLNIISSPGSAGGRLRR